MNKYFIIILLSNYLSCNNVSQQQIFPINNIKTCCVPLSDAYPMRYYYHSPFAENEFNNDCDWGFKLLLNYRYQHTFHGNTLATSIFGSNPLMAIYEPDLNPFLSGNNLAIGMSEDSCDSTTNINASINNNFITFTCNICKSDCDWYANIGLPVCRTANKLCLSEIVKTDGMVSKGAFALEYEEDDEIETDYEFIPSDEFRAIGSLTKYLSGSIIGDMTERMYAKINPNCSISEWALSDIYLQFGYDCFKRDNSLFGFYLRAVIPTSPKLSYNWAINTFSPVIGNAGRWEIDLGLNSHIYLWNYDDKYLELTADIYAGYISGANHFRTFDFLTGPLTRYGAIKEFVIQPSGLYYAGSFPWGADLTTQCVSVGVPVRGEVVLDLLYRSCGHVFDIGYNFKGQSSEQTSSCISIAKKGLYGLCSRGRVQTPFEETEENSEKTILAWADWLVTPHSGMSIINSLDITKLNINPNIPDVIGIPMDQDFILNSTNINVNSGLMNGQILNVLFFGYKYTCNEYSINPFFELRGSIGWSTITHYSPETWDIMIGFGTSY